jgi:uncharacterized protein YciI
MPLRTPAIPFLAALAFAAALHAQSPAPPPAEKLYAVTFTVGPKWDPAKPPQDQPFFREHSAHLARLRAENRSVLGGRFADKGLLLLRAPDAAAARAALAGDPSLAAGTFAATVDEYRPFQHGDTRPPLATPEVAVVRAVLAAYNAHRADDVLALLADDVQLLSLDAAAGIEFSGRDAVRRWIEGLFAAAADIRSEPLELLQSGPFVSYRERSSWTDSAGTRHVQTSLAVYEVRDGRVARAWFTPATAAPPPAPAR